MHVIARSEATWQSPAELTGHKWTSTCFRLRCPANVLGANAIVPRRPRHTLRPRLTPPQAALGLAAIPNTEVKLICADNTWRATAREDR